MKENKPRIRLEVRLKADEKAKLWRVAKEQGLSPSELIRKFIQNCE